MNEQIVIKNVHIHNLKGIDVTIPRNKLTVITGVSGSGKSSLAFDTLYEEGKRRYLMFSGTQFMVDSAPSFDRITGLSPTVAVEQRIIRQSNPRSTVGTRTKISAMIAALYANYGVREEAYEDGLPLAMEMFQKNSPKGMCVKCLGTGTVRQLDEEKLFADGTQRIDEVCLGIGKHGNTRRVLEAFCKQHGLDCSTKLNELSQDQLSILKYGDSGRSVFPGFIPWIQQVINGVFSSSGRLAHLLKQGGYLKVIPCPKCNATGLGIQATHTRIGGKTVDDMERMYISDLKDFLVRENRTRPNPLCSEIITKLECMIEVGLHHLALSRSVVTLSGGEIQRLFLAAYIITEMDSIIFVFDEPTIGLHEMEKQQLIAIIRNLVDRGNTVIAVEHDANFMREADYIVDLGPGAGELGGIKIYEGDLNGFIKCKESKTAPFLADVKNFHAKTEYRQGQPGKTLMISHANIHNLRDVTVEIPLGGMVGIAGRSGSGKSSLIADTLVPKLQELMNKKSANKENEEASEELFEETEEQIEEQAQVQIRGAEYLKKCFVIDQKPIGRSRTSCPATYTGIFDRIRTLFSQTDTSKEKGYTAGLFSVNSEGGCKVCKGDGVIHYHVGFGNFIDVGCEACGGTGYIEEAMEVCLDGKNIRDILDMTVDEAAAFFEKKDTAIFHMLYILQRVGMGYIRLGQSTPTISGGESQRIKLAKELAKGKNAKNSLYILDEPTTGLSFSDSERLLKLMNELVDLGNTIIITEHDPFLLSNCDYLIEMGIGGGSDGGNVIATGTPAQLKANKASIIGGYLL